MIQFIKSDSIEKDEFPRKKMLIVEERGEMATISPNGNTAN